MSKLSKISLNGTVYDLDSPNDGVYQVVATSENPFIITEHEPGVYFFNNSPSGRPYVKWKATDPSSFYLSPAGVYFFWDTNGDDENSRNIGEVINFGTNPGLAVVSYDSTTGGVSAGQEAWPILMVTNQARTITAKHTFNILPQSTAIPTDDAQLVNKKYVDDNTLHYYDSGYYITPTQWTVVSSLPAYTRPDTLYFVCPDYVEKNQMVSVSSNGFNEGVTWSHITTNLIKPSDDSIVESWQATATESTNNTSTTIRAPKYSVKLGATPNYTNTIGDDLNMYGVYEARNPETTALLYSAYLDVDSGLTSGTMYYFDRDEYDNTDIEVNMTGYTSIYYTIGTNGGLACLKGDTPVLIKSNKKKNIKDIKEGDIVIDSSGKETKVIKTLSHNIDMTFNIELSNNDILTASYGHKFSIKNHFRRACQVVKDHELDRQDGSVFKVINTEVKQETITVYEILTESKTYVLGNGIICECEDI